MRISLANYESGIYFNQPTYDVNKAFTAGYLVANSRLEELVVQGSMRYDRDRFHRAESRPGSASRRRQLCRHVHRLMEKSVGNPYVLFCYENYGTNWTFSIRGNF